MFQAVHLVNHAVDEGRYAVDQCHLGTLLQMAFLVVPHVEEHHLQFLLYILLSVVQLADVLSIAILPLL